MNKEETLALYKKGRTAWNAWAEEMLMQRTKLVETGQWVAQTFILEGTVAFGRFVALEEIGNNQETRDWLCAARTDFFGYIFDGVVDFAAFKFPSVATFYGAKFKSRVTFEAAQFLGYARFDEASFKDNAQFRQAFFASNAWFEGASFNRGAQFPKVTFTSSVSFDNVSFAGLAHFSGGTFAAAVWFEGALFEDKALFVKTIFRGNAQFTRASFNGEARFPESLFEGDANFGEAKFSCLALFDKASFRSDAEFGTAVFGGKGWFSKVTFAGGAWFQNVTFINDARFNQTIFADYAFFYKTIFKKESFFCGIKGQGLFSFAGATFYSVPDFEQAHFSEAPQLDDIHLTVDSPQSFTSSAPNKNCDLPARWRALKRLAIQGHDYERELNFLAEEVKALRGVQDWLLPNPLSFRKGDPICWPGGGRYWFGLFYQWFSDFGRSTLRPFLCWLIVTGLSALFYFNYSLPQNLDNRSHASAGIVALICDPAMDALYLSIHNGLVVSGLGRGEKLAQSYTCLYGNSGKNQLIPIMPNTVVLVGIGQTILSAVLIFLFLLALRNYFRIK